MITFYIRNVKVCANVSYQKTRSRDYDPSIINVTSKGQYYQLQTFTRKSTGLNCLVKKELRTTEESTDVYELSVVKSS